MAVAALHFRQRVRLLQRPAGSPVIEALRFAVGGGPLDEGEVRTRVIGVAARALHSLDRAAPVDSSAAIRQPGNVAVAGEAARVHARITARVAAGALEWAFELTMGARQRSRRYLGPERLGEPAAEQQHGCAERFHQNQVIPIATTTAT